MLFKGTGKSFIGSLIAKAIHKFSSQKILVVCYTNHALDQILEDFLDKKIPASGIIRLGSVNKATARTKPLLLSEKRRNFPFSRDLWAIYDKAKHDVSVSGSDMMDAFSKFLTNKISNEDLLEHIEFLCNDEFPYFEAFQLPDEHDGMVHVDSRGKAISEFYLLRRWAQGKDAGPYKSSVGKRYASVWRIPMAKRQETMKHWKTAMLEERTSMVQEFGAHYNSALAQIDALHKQKDVETLRQANIIGCTTTSAAMNVDLLQSVSPEVLIVEEAGEILESHVLTALSPDTKQVVLIGDHKQLRPKAHFDLSVEKGDGYDLNRSLFERLFLSGYPCQALHEQHRMRPEISSFVRELTYPNLADASSTKGRANLRGFTDNIIFLDHRVPEDEAEINDWHDTTSRSSKKNIFEVNMILKFVRYLSQQGYGTDDMVVLTPYLAQLRLMIDVLSKENDPVLNDLDSYDLVRAGLLPAATARAQKSQLRMSTIGKFNTYTSVRRRRYQLTATR